MPAYSDIFADVIAGFQGIYGATAYLQPDGADYQLLSIFSAKIADVMQAIQLAYNARSPLTAIGADLDSIVKLNGLVRGAATPSTVALTVSGNPTTVITGGYAEDLSGNSWQLPTPLTIPSGGSVVVTATCATPGPISAAAGTVSIIGNPTSGWTRVTNAAPAVLGTSVETDAALRARQALSVALPSLTTVGSTEAAIAAVPGVTRYNILENPTGAADSYGNPAHSLTCVVEGGADLAVATAIYLKHGIGAFTNGTTSVPVVDTYTGTTFNVGFYRPTYVQPYVSITLSRLAGFTSATAAAVQTAIVAYLNSLQIGESLTRSALYGAALSVMPNLSQPQFSITSLTLGSAASPTGTADITVTFNQVVQGVTARVVVTS